MAQKKDSNPNQMSFMVSIKPGSLAIQGEIKGALSKMFRKCNLSRFQIAAQISELVGYEVTKSMLDNYTAESHDDVRTPADILLAATDVCRDYSIIQLLCGYAGGDFVSGEDREYMELAKIQRDILRLQAREKDLRARLAG